MDNIRRGNRQLIKDLNRILVLKTILNYEPVSRTKIAKLTELSLSTISHIVASLIKRGVVQEIGEEKSNGGRRPIMLKLNPEVGLVIGIKIGLDGIVAALVNLKGAVLYKITRPVPINQGEKDVIESIANVIRSLIKEAYVDFSRIIGCGIGISGLVDSKRGILLRSPILSWEKIQFGKLLRREFNIPIFVDKDVNALALGEKRCGAARGISNFVCITVGTGIGAGIVVDGKIYHGNLGEAGELGHTIIDKNGPLCYCGKYGCLETLASYRFIVEQAKNALAHGKKTLINKLLGSNDPNSLSVSTVLQAAHEGDQVARDIFKRAGENLGIGISNLIGIVDPEAILMGGRGIEAGELILSPMRKAIKENSPLRRDIKVLFPELGEDGWIIGAAELVLKEIFKVPIFKFKKGNSIKSVAELLQKN